MRRYWPFLAFAAVALVHVTQLLLSTDSLASKAALMPVLLFAIIFVCGFTGREALASRRGVGGVLLLIFAILVSWLADIIFDKFGDAALRDQIGIAASGVTVAILVGLFAGPLRGRWSWWFLTPYILVAGAGVAFMFPSLGGYAPVVIGYALLAAMMGFLATGSGPYATIGAAAFFVNALLKGLRLFQAEAFAAVPGYVLDALNMTLYCTGLGLIAFGATRRLVALGAGAAAVRRSRVAPIWEMLAGEPHARMR